MSKELANRRHGDGGLTANNRHFWDNPDKEVGLDKDLRDLTDRVIREMNLQFELGSGAFEPIGRVYGSIRRRFEVAYSNGCPHPEKAMLEQLKEAKKEGGINSLQELIKAIDAGAAGDGKHSMIFQLLVEAAKKRGNSELLEILQSEFDWEPDPSDEHQNLPELATNVGRGRKKGIGYGLASPELYEKVVIPLRKLVDRHIGSEYQDLAWTMALDLIDIISKTNSFEKMVEIASYSIITRAPETLAVSPLVERISKT